ncbi:MAG TPA: YcnI family protein [Gaiellaceae bacterium]|nr:YcnI family protein [Gaiellaceae bacterium]
MLRKVIASIALAAVAFPAAAAAHVTIQPGEWEAGAFATMVVRVPNERDDAETTTVTVQFPESIPSARFKPHPACEREVQREELAEPVEDLTERIASVTWTCDPAIPADGFDEFGISLRVPEDAQPGDEILFPAIQVYSSGEEVGWIDPDPEGDSPAPRITIVAPEEEAAEEGEAAAAETTTEESTDEAADEAAAIPAVSSEDDDGSTATVAIILAIAGLAAGLLALGVAFFRKPTGST